MNEATRILEIQRLDEAITRAKEAGLSKEQALAEVNYIFDTPEAGNLT